MKAKILDNLWLIHYLIFCASLWFGFEHLTDDSWIMIGSFIFAALNFVAVFIGIEIHENQQK